MNIFYGIIANVCWGITCGSYGSRMHLSFIEVVALSILGSTLLYKVFLEVK